MLVSTLSIGEPRAFIAQELHVGLLGLNFSCILIPKTIPSCMSSALASTELWSQAPLEPLVFYGQ